MRWSRLWVRCGFIGLSCLLSATPAQAQVITDLHTFVGGPNDGGAPSGSLIQQGQFLYGMTSGGGINSSGTIFQIGTDGTGFGLMYRFTGLSNDGYGPTGSLIQYGSAFWGLTAGGGASRDGTMFRINTDGTNFGLRYQFAGTPTNGHLHGGMDPRVHLFEMNQEPPNSPHQPCRCFWSNLKAVAPPPPPGSVPWVPPCGGGLV